MDVSNAIRLNVYVNIIVEHFKDIDFSRPIKCSYLEHASVESGGDII